MPARSTMLAVILTLATFSALAQASLKPAGPRKVLSLDGAWQVEQGSMDAIPASFSHEVPVPGLLDMARPAFQDIGRKSPLRQAFWYRRTFTVDGSLPAIAILKISKARYGTRVFLNGQLVGDHLPCFTPAYLDVAKYLKGDGQSNELVIRVGADRDSMPRDIPAGWDFEKYLFIPGIYDSVELILTGAPYIVNVQAVPDIASKSVRVVVEIQSANRPADFTLRADVAEAASGTAAGSNASAPIHLNAGQLTKVDLTIPIDRCHLWSPDHPFLYELKLSTGLDAAKVRFGMRSFTFDPATRRAVLNGKPFYMRGTNVTAYRFFEDAARGDKPWRAEWVRRLHQAYKTMHWNSIRYCIGFPPEIWYDIADEEGFLIQDEFPIWLLNPSHKPPSPEQPTADKIIPQYVEWMRERWNHACVVIWDGQNESQTDETGKAIRAVRNLDLSNRPWENGWAEPNSANDCIESHPYLFIRTWFGDKPFFMRELAGMTGEPHLTEAQKRLHVGVIINEYDWLWLTRDGNPTCLTDKVYESLLGKNSTVDQRRQLHARYVAALTEFWRCHRGAAAVLHFCGLGYSRPGDKPRPEGGATSDDFTDIEKLTYEPHFAQHVREAFNPLGLMLDFWAEELPANTSRPFKVYIINDEYADWQGELRLHILAGGKDIPLAAKTCKVAALGQKIVTLDATLPAQNGNCTLVAELKDSHGRMIHSMRDAKLK